MERSQMLFATEAGITLMPIFFAMNMLVFALLSLGAGEYVVAVGDVVSGLVTLAFLPRSI
jgi:hypothetical protein